MNVRDRLMQLLRSPFTRSSLMPTGDSQDDYGWGPVRANSPTNYSKTGRSARLLGYEQHPTVAACIRLVAEALAAVPVQTYTRKESDGSPTALPLNTPTRLVLDRPRIGMTRYYLWLLTVTHYQLYGNAFWVLERAGRSSPKAIRLVHPEDVLIVILNPDTLEPAFYIWRDRQGKQHESAAEDVVHFRDGSGKDWLFGYPRAATALLEMATEREASDMVRQWLVNDGSPGHIGLMTDGATTREGKAAEAQWRSGMVDRGGRGSVRFLTGIKDWKVIGFNLEQLEFPSLRAISRESICTAFNVDPRLVGASSAKGNDGGLSQAGYPEARRRLYSQNVIPMMKNFESTLDADFGVEWGFVFCRFDPDVLADLMETEAERADRSSKLLTAGSITRQESRRILRYPEEMVPTDTLVGSLGRLEYPVAAAEAKVQAALLPPTPPNTDGGQGGGNADDQATADQAAADKAKADEATAAKAKEDAQRTVMNQPRRFLKRGMVLSSEARQEAWNRFAAYVQKVEVPYRVAAETLLSEERQEIVAGLMAHPDGKSARAEPDPFLSEAQKRIRKDFGPGGKYHKRWVDRYRSLIGETIVTSGQDVATAIGFSFNLQNPLVQEAVLDRSKILATQVCDYSSTTISSIISEGQRQGLGVREVAKLLQSTLQGMEPSRAIRIARTETVGALNQGEFLSAQQSDILVEKEWLCEFNNSRESHMELDGTRIPMNDTFDNGLQYPGDKAGDADEVINCQCSLLFYD
jgi:HK97 family phage portal protein